MGEDHIEISLQASPGDTGAAAPLADELDTPVADLLAVPYLWIGTISEIAQQLRSACERRGISRWVVRAPALDHATKILAGL